MQCAIPRCTFSNRQVFLGIVDLHKIMSFTHAYISGAGVMLHAVPFRLHFIRGQRVNILTQFLILVF